MGTVTGVTPEREREYQEAASVMLRNRADPNRRQFSVLCHRGWCDVRFRHLAVAAAAAIVTGKYEPERTPRSPSRACHMPFTCECVCHDEIRATVAGRPTAHAAATYTRRSGFSVNHAVLDRPLAVGRFKRDAGEALCNRGSEFSGPAPRSTGEVECPTCLSRALRYGVMLP